MRLPIRKVPHHDGAMVEIEVRHQFARQALIARHGDDDGLYCGTSAATVMNA